MAAVFFLTTPSDRLRGVSPSEVGLRHGQMSKIKTDDLRRERKNRDGRSGGWGVEGLGKRMSGWGVEERGKKTDRLCHRAATFIVWWHPCCGIVPRRDINSNHQFHHNRQLTQAANIVEPVTRFTLYMRSGQIRGWIYMCPTNHTILKAILQISLSYTTGFCWPLTKRITLLLSLSIISSLKWHMT